MPKDVTASDLLTRVRRRIDRPVDDSFISDSEIYDEIEASYSALWDLCARKGLPLEEATETVNAATGTQEYQMPAAFFSPIGVSYEHSSTVRTDLTPVAVHERNRFSLEASSPSYGYRMYTDSSGDVQMILYPPPTTGDTYYVLYVPTAPVITASSSIRGINGWEEWIVNDVAVRLKIKEGLDPRECAAVRDEIQRERLAPSDLRREGPARVKETNPDNHMLDAADWYYGIRRGGY